MSECEQADRQPLKVIRVQRAYVDFRRPARTRAFTVSISICGFRQNYLEIELYGTGQTCTETNGSKTRQYFE